MRDHMAFIRAWCGPFAYVRGAGHMFAHGVYHVASLYLVIACACFWSYVCSWCVFCAVALPANFAAWMVDSCRLRFVSLCASK